MRGQGSEAIAVVGDVASSDDVDRLARTTVEAFGIPLVLWWGADSGASAEELAADAELEDWATD